MLQLALLRRSCPAAAAAAAASGSMRGAAAVARRLHATSPAVPSDSTAALRAARDGDLRATLTAKRAALAELERTKEVCDKLAYHYPDKFMKRLFAFLVLQAVVLYDWTYVHFDWNLVEPITYLVGYSATWIAIAWYGTMQHEFGYASLRSFLQTRKRDKLYKAKQFDPQAYEALRAEVAQLDRIVRSLEGL